jgi:hypothetical protein
MRSFLKYVHSRSHEVGDGPADLSRGRGGQGRGTSNLAPRVGHVASSDLDAKPRSPKNTLIRGWRSFTVSIVMRRSGLFAKQQS